MERRGSPEVNEGELQIEQYLYRTDPYRSTTVKFPFPMPLAVHSLDATLTVKLHQDSQLRTFILKSLEFHQIRELSLHFSNLSKPGYPRGGDIHVPTLRINVELDDHALTESWPAATRDIYLLLGQRGFPGIEVEIIEPNRCYRPSLFPIPPQDAHIAKYESVRKDLVRFITTELGNAWRMMCIFKVGRNSDKTGYAVVVMVQPFTIQDWPRRH